VPQWVRIEGWSLVAGGQPMRLRGIGLGNWMLVEHFMIGLQMNKPWCKPTLQRPKDR